MTPSITSCEKDAPNPSGGVVTPVITYKEYTVTPKLGEIYFTLPDGTKIAADTLVQFKVKENPNTGSKDIKLQFDAIKLKTSIENILI
ncbi:hypothetical protein EGI22_00525 [Lacihabitans sp. LS3-19]|nr:hypothetical protein [Lacihabitans sp. LS3-19]